MFRLLTKISLALAITGMLASGVASADQAETKLLRWKFREGEQLTLICTQTIDTRRTVKGQSAEMSMILTSEMDWRVKSVAKNGNADIVQSFRRLSAKLSTAKGSSITFDSAAKIKPTGLAKDVAEKLLPLIGKEFTVAMTSRGSITKVTLSDELSEAIEEAAGTKGPRTELFTAAGISDLMKQFAVQLPEKPIAKGGKWTTKHSAKLPIGRLQLANQFEYQGPQVVNGRPVLKIGLSSQVKVATPSKRTKLRKYEHTGTIQFDEVFGRLVTATSKQTITATTRLRDVIIEVQLKTTINTRLKKKAKAKAKKAG